MATRAQGKEVPGLPDASEPVEVAREPAEAPPLELLNAMPEGPADADAVKAAFEPPPSPEAAPSAASPSPGAEAPKFERWSNTRLKNAKRNDMAKRIRELEAVAVTKPAPAAGVAPEPTPEVLTEQTAKALMGTFAIIGKVGARIRGEHWDLQPAECEMLAAVWSPVLAPHLGTLAEYLPLASAIGVTAQVVWPRVERDMQLAKASQAEQVPAVVTPGESAA